MSICTGMCDIQRECLFYAEDTQERHGVWGGVLFSSRNLQAKIDEARRKLDLKEASHNEGENR